jgi:hypothetical protein
MWLKIGNGYLNLNNIVSVHFARDDNGEWLATAETVSGSVKHYPGADAEALKEHFESLGEAPAREA